MYKTSEKYKKAIYNHIRENKARVIFDITDITVREDNKTISTSEEFILSNKEQVDNDKKEKTYKIITCEDNRVKLDGTYIFADDVITNNGETGWVSNDMCNESGVFGIEQIISYRFEETHSLIGLTINFDSLNNEYATEFEVRAYDNDNSLINNILITDNLKAEVEVIGQLLNFSKIEIAIKKWNKGYRRAKVLEIDWGVIRVYEDDKLIKFNFIEEIDINSSQIPSNEFKFTINNSDKLFNILNPKGFYKFLQEKQNIRVEIGTVLDDGSVEYVPVGNFLLSKWKSDEGDLTATFTANTRLDLMDSYNYENLEEKINHSIYNLIEELFEICSIKEYEIDIKLKNIITKGLIEKTTCKEVLQMALIAGMANIFISKDNKIIIKQDLKEIVDGSIKLEDMYQVPKVELDEAIKTIEVDYYNTLEENITVILVDNTLKLGGSMKLESNTLIDTEARAIEVATWLLSRSKLRNRYTLDWRGNPSLELLDLIDIDNYYNEEIKAYITKTEIEYVGYLKGNTELTGGIK